MKIELVPKIKCKLSINLEIALNILEMNREKLEIYLEWNKHIKDIYLDKRGVDGELSLYLEEQLGYEKISLKEKEVVRYLIYNLNSNGYLVDIEKIKSEIKIEKDIFEKGVKILKSFLPVGIGSESLKECLLKQIENRKSLKLREIIEYNLEDIANKNYLKIAKERDLKIQLVLKYIDEIKRLNPIPSRGYGDSKAIVYIKPDIYLKIEGDEMKVQIANEFVEQYILTNKDDNIIHSCLKKREETLLKISKYILEFQKEYILKRGSLKEIKIKNIALKFDLHSSTIYRVIKDKYIQINNGKIEFLRNYIGKNREKEIIKGEIKKILFSYNYNISDERIVKILAKIGYNIARRTVTKYRNEMGIKKRYRKKEREEI